MKMTIVTTLLIPIASYAGLFGPSNFQDCILEGMKGVTSDTAAGMIARVCRQKFPDKQSAPSQETKPFEYPERFRFYRFDKDIGGAVITPVSKISMNRVSTETHGTDYGSGVKSYDFGYHLTIEVTNRNNFSIDGYYVGVPKKGNNCGLAEADYAETYECSGSAAEGMSGKFRCDIPRLEKRNISVCGLGFVFRGTRTELLTMKSRNSIP